MPHDSISQTPACQSQRKHWGEGGHDKNVKKNVTNNKRQKHRNSPNKNFKIFCF